MTPDISGLFDMVGSDAFRGAVKQWRQESGRLVGHVEVDQPKRLAVLTTFYNPVGYEAPRRNFERFREALGDVPLYVAELTFGTPPTIPGAVHLDGNGANVLWQKERLLNVLLDRLPPQFDRVAWIDADILFDNPEWYSQTVEALDESPLVQLFDRAEVLGPSGEVTETFPGFAAQGGEGHTGFAWAARRDQFEGLGFQDQCVLGCGDAVMAASAFGVWRNPILYRFPEALRRACLLWGWEFFGRVGGNVGHVPGKVTHLFHGTRENRQYPTRERILVQHGFDPARDLVLDGGLWRWADPASGLARDVAAYFEARREDG